MGENNCFLCCGRPPPQVPEAVEKDPRDTLQQMPVYQSPDDRSLSLPSADVPASDQNFVHKRSNASIIFQSQQQLTSTSTAVSANSATTTTDGADSGIGSDCPKSGELTSMKELPPEVPPKPRRNSFAGSIGSYHDPDEEMRQAYEDSYEYYSTMGREKSVLPAFLRPLASANASASANGDAETKSITSQKTVTSRIEPDLVGKDRYDPNSKCFSYVPAKSLKEHYKAPKKPSRRRSVVEHSDLNIPEKPEALVVAESLRKLNMSSDDLTRDPEKEVPKWEAEINKISGKLPDSPPARSKSTVHPAFQPPPEDALRPKSVHRDEDEIDQISGKFPARYSPPRRSKSVHPAFQTPVEDALHPKAAHREEDELDKISGKFPSRYSPRNKHIHPAFQAPVEDALHPSHHISRDEHEIDQISGKFPARYSPPPRNKRIHPAFQPPAEDALHPKHHKNNTELDDLIPNGYLPNSTSTRPSRSTFNERRNYEDVAERPLILDQRKKATTRSSSPSRYSSQPALNQDRNDMDELLDPDFYFTITSTPSRYKPQAAVQPRDRSAPSPIVRPKMEESSGTYPMKPISQRDLDDLNDTIERKTSKRSENYSPQPYATSSRIPNEDYRLRHSRSVNSTPLIIRERKIITHDNYDALSDSETNDDWLTLKLKALQNKRYMDPDAQKRRNTEKILLEELKNVTAERDAARGKREQDYSFEGMGRKQEPNGDPLEEYKREEERLKNTESPFVDELRIANRLTQKQQQRGHHQPSYLPSNLKSNTDSFTSTTLPGWSETTTPTITPLPSTPLAAQARRGATPTGQIVKGKPPTPPPTSRGHEGRERFSPARSPMTILQQRRAGASSTPPMNAATRTLPVGGDGMSRSAYQRERSRLVRSENLSDDENESGDEGADFGNLRKLIQSNRAKTVGPIDSHSANTPISNANTQSAYSKPNGTKSILKRQSFDSGRTDDWEESRRGSNAESNNVLYASPDKYKSSTLRNETPNEESPKQQRLSNLAQGQLDKSASLPYQASSRQTPTQRGDRSDTPAFPVGSASRNGGGDTPLPYHPLLYQNSEDFSSPQYTNNTYPGGNITQRGASPRSMYYGQSRRSSMTSIGQNQGKQSDSQLLCPEGWIWTNRLRLASSLWVYAFLGPINTLLLMSEDKIEQRSRCLPAPDP
ncbi:CRE-TAG protein [Ditylenchus destructor]|nr:CRE-TAG protein [Ditylenchus destructor]